MRNYLLIPLFILAISGCGGGGGGGGELKAAAVSLDVNDTSIAIGDRTLVRLFISDVDVNGVILKFRYDSSLGYIENTTTILVDDTTTAPDPVEGPREGRQDNYIYLIYYIPLSLVGEDGVGEINFQLRGLSADDSAEIEIDTDLHAPGADPADEFLIKEPLFSAEDTVAVGIRR